VCTDCGGTVIEYDAAAGNGFCVQCGTVLEENTIINEVSFGETAAGAAMVQGSYVGQGASKFGRVDSVYVLKRIRSSRSYGGSIWKQREYRVEGADYCQW
jgi:transcription initiation factor TFIIIB Brf1 subunit/transcription initiation factor TFIIB